jgi:hypothetical protein
MAWVQNSENVSHPLPPPPAGGEYRPMYFQGEKGGEKGGSERGKKTKILKNRINV